MLTGRLIYQMMHFNFLAGFMCHVLLAVQLHVAQSILVGFQLSLEIQAACKHILGVYRPLKEHVEVNVAAQLSLPEMNKALMR